MKTNFLTLVLFLGFISCKEKAPDQSMEEKAPKMEESITQVPKDTVSLAKFTKWTGDWMINKATIPSNGLPIAFTMPKVDLSQALATVGIDSARFYIGLDVSTNALHLLLCGVDSTGKNMLDYSRGQYVYDYTVACPPLCGNVR